MLQAQLELGVCGWYGDVCGDLGRCGAGCMVAGMSALNWRRRRNIGTIVLAAFMLFAFWCFGIDLTQRGPDLGMALVMSVGIAFACWICPLWRYVNGRRQP